MHYYWIVHNKSKKIVCAHNFFIDFLLPIFICFSSIYAGFMLETANLVGGIMHF